MAITDKTVALTEIARKLKETFSGFEAAGFQSEVDKYRAIYHDAESIRIGEMDYIVINDVYRSDDVGDNVPEGASSLFFNSINHDYAIIDAETSSTLIDEVYSRVTYMQRDCTTDATPPDEEERKSSLKSLVGEGEEIVKSDIEQNVDDADLSLSKNRANIFQCQLIKDTGVSAAPDVYSFMLKGEEIKEIADSAIRQIKNSGIVKMLNDSNVEELKNNEGKIQEAVFNKYINADIDIQSVTVKSIFEIRMEFCNVHLWLERHLGNGKAKSMRVKSIFNTSLLASKDKEFEALNSNIHVCNTCKKDLVDVRDEASINKIHTNLDAYDEVATLDYNGGKFPDGDLERIVYATGCESCLEKCEECGGWHFNYKKLHEIDKNEFAKIHFVPGREFVKSILSFDINYCACRENIEWVYDEMTGKTEHEVIPITELAFINYANEKMADYKDYEAFYKKRKGSKSLSGLEEKEFAKETMDAFKAHLADKFEMSVDGISISSNERCHICNICGGQYYKSIKNGRCAVCAEMFEENHHMVTRVDGIVFMRGGRKDKKYINKYIVTKLGNLKLLSSKRISTSEEDR